MPIQSNLPPILVVDDNDDDLHLIKRLLAKTGVKHPVATFNDGAKVMPFLKAAAAAPKAGLMPCLVLTDVQMPGFDGFELVEWIRGERALAGLTVVMLSSSTQEKDIKRAKAIGVDEFLMKLPTPEAMAKIVARACKKPA